MSKISTSSREWAQAGFKDFVSETLASPYALQPAYAAGNQIANRASIANDLKATLGVERLPVVGIKILPNEFGPNGEQVFEPLSKDARVRAVGTWLNFSNSNGTFFASSVLNDWVEVAFYGTGLNALVHSEGSRAFRVTTDGGTEVATDLNTSASAVLAGRSYNMNSVVSCVSGLTLGWHVCKLRQNVNATNVIFMGFEIVGPSSLTVPAGNAFSGMNKDSLILNTTSAHTSSVTGSRGGRIVKYLKDSVIAETFQVVDAAAAYSASASHGNEEVVRRVQFREFGANRADDFSTLVGSTGNRTYTLDDGVTNLNSRGVTQNVGSGVEGFYITTANNDFWTITFVGTGLDVIATQHNGSTGNTPNEQLIVDGVLQDTRQYSLSPIDKQIKLVSGLPYGTHTVKLAVLATGAGITGDFNTKEFIIYQPKKPSLPVGAIELADFNVMATYVANASQGAAFIGAGVLRKQNIREMVYGGGGSWGITADFSTCSGYLVNDNATTGDFIQYVFFGTGFDFRYQQASSSTTATITVDGSTNLSGFTTSTYGSGNSLVASTGVLTIGSSSLSGCGVSVSGLSLGLHTVKITLTTTSGGGFRTEAFDVITPIHSHDKGFLKVGSLAMQDSRNKTPSPVNPLNGVDFSKAKAWLMYDVVNTKIVSSFNIGAVLSPSTGTFDIVFQRPFKSRPVIAGTHQSDGGLQAPTSGFGGTDLAWRSAIRIITRDNAGSAASAQSFSIVCFGELENEENQ